MSLVASSISGAAYVLGGNEDKDNGNGFEFTRRKKWPQLLLQELTSSALFCLKPMPGAGASTGGSDGKVSQSMGWKVMFVSPSVNEMLGIPPTDIDGRDFLDYVYPADHPQLNAMLNSLITPHLTHQPSTSSSNSSSTAASSTPHPLPVSTSSQTLTTYIRMSTSPDSRPGSSRGPVKQNSGSSGSGSSSSNGPSGSGANSPKTVVWEIRAHATGVEGSADLPAFGLAGGGTMVPTTSGGDDMKGKAVWLMGRRVGENVGDESNGQSLDAFLELKLENEKLREELRELQSDFDEDDYQTGAFPDSATRQSYLPSTSSSPTPSSSSSSPASSPGFASAPARPKPGPGRPPKDPATKEKDREAAREKKRAKKSANASARAAGGAGGGGGGDGEGGMHVCVTCGRTDSPEWRKGPLGPKTLCNACGLRWAKRNSTAPTRKDKKAAGAGPSK